MREGEGLAMGNSAAEGASKRLLVPEAAGRVLADKKCARTKPSTRWA